MGVCREIRKYGLPYYVLCTRVRVVCSRREKFGDSAQSVVRVWWPRRGRWLVARRVGVVHGVLLDVVEQVRAGAAGHRRLRRRAEH